jgi:hypothetical protein
MGCWWPVQDMVRLRIRYLGRAECRPWKGADSRRKIDRVRSLGKCGGLPIAPLEHGKWTFSFCEILTYFKFQARKIISCGKPTVKNSKSSPITTLMGGINHPQSGRGIHLPPGVRRGERDERGCQPCLRALGFSWGYPNSWMLYCFIMEHP